MKRRPPKPRRQTTAYRWSRVIQHRPWTSALAGAVVLLFLAIPVLGLRLGYSDESNYSDEHLDQAGLRPAGRRLRPRLQRPAAARRRAARGHRPRQPRGGQRGRGGRPRRGARLAAPAERGRAPRSSGRSSRTVARRRRRRPTSSSGCATDVLPPVEDEIGTQVSVTGNVAVGIDFTDYLASRHAVLLRRGAGPVVPAADGRVPVAARAAQGRDHEHAVDRRRLRHRRRPVPVGLAQRHHGGAASAHRAVDPDDAVRHRLRVVDGLRGVPALPHPRGVDPHRRQPHRGGRRPGLDGQGHHGGGRHHGVRLRQLHPRETTVSSS